MSNSFRRESSWRNTHKTCRRKDRRAQSTSTWHFNHQKLGGFDAAFGPKSAENAGSWSIGTSWKSQTGNDRAMGQHLFGLVNELGRRKNDPDSGFDSDAEFDFRRRQKCQEFASFVLIWSILRHMRQNKLRTFCWDGDVFDSAQHEFIHSYPGVRVKWGRDFWLRMTSLLFSKKFCC